MALNSFRHKKIKYFTVSVNGENTQVINRSKAPFKTMFRHHESQFYVYIYTKMIHAHKYI